MGGIRSFLILIACIVGFPIALLGGTDSLARRQVFYLGRIVPFHTVAKDVSFQLTGKRGVFLMPEETVEIPIIKITDRALADSLGVAKGDLIPVSYILNEKGEYQLGHLYLTGNSEFDKALKQLDGKAQLIYLYSTNQLWSPLPEETESIPQWKVSLEIFFNKADFTSWLYIVGFSMLAIELFLIILKRRNGLWFMGILPFLISLLDFILMWIIKGEIPLTNGEEVMVFLSMLLFFLSTVISVKNPTIGSGILAMGCFTALVGHITGGSHIVVGTPQALISPWLAIHVSVIMSSYAVLAVLLPFSIAMEIRKSVRKLIPAVKVMNLIGVILLGAGIIIGSLWAKGAWGSFWSWDPKETWALLTFLAYLTPLIFWKWIDRRPKIYGMVLILAFCFMVMTYFGVNYFIGGMHSYV